MRDLKKLLEYFNNLFAFDAVCVNAMKMARNTIVTWPFAFTSGIFLFFESTISETLHFATQSQAHNNCKFAHLSTCLTSVQSQYSYLKCYNIIHRSEEPLDIQSELIFVNGMVHALTPGMKLWYTNNSSFTSYTTFTPHSESRSDFSSYMTSNVHLLMYKIIAMCIERTTELWTNICVTCEYKSVMCEYKSVLCYSQLINWCLAPPLRVNRF